VGEESSGFWDDIVPRVDSELCRRCPDCPPVASCLAQAIHRDGPDRVPVIDEGFCFGCYSCAASCPHGAIILPRQGR
jgi:Fe-S-cluster-containing hydrogenase component 2